jgi:CRISPR-associated protein Cas5d
LRKGNQLQKDASYQLIAVILVGVCYRLNGVVDEPTAWPGPANDLYALQEIFERRLRNGQCFSMRRLGWKEFTPSYLGPFRDSAIEESLTLQISSMLHRVFDNAVGGKWQPSYPERSGSRKALSSSRSLHHFHVAVEESHP